MWVVKLGGSLSEDISLKEWLWSLSEYGGGKVVLVPGGGRFADQVRVLQQHWKINDRIAHCMAILAMHQTGLLFLGLEPRLMLARTEEIGEVLRQGKTAVWLPEIAELDRAGIPASWAVTSDSLAAWLAGKLHAGRLVLVKAKTPPSLDPLDLRDSGLVDEAFLDYWLPKIELDCYRRDESAQFSRKLRAISI